MELFKREFMEPCTTCQNPHHQLMVVTDSQQGQTCWPFRFKIMGNIKTDNILYIAKHSQTMHIITVMLCLCVQQLVATQAARYIHTQLYICTYVHTVCIYTYTKVPYSYIHIHSTHTYIHIPFGSTLRNAILLICMTLVTSSQYGPTKADLKLEIISILVSVLPLILLVIVISLLPCDSMVKTSLEITSILLLHHCIYSVLMFTF